jgi:hypothetical protein
MLIGVARRASSKAVQIEQEDHAQRHDEARYPEQDLHHAKHEL